MSTNNSLVTKRKLNTLTAIIKLLRDSKSFNETLQLCCDMLPQAYAGTGEVSVKITVDELDFFSKHFNESQWLERKQITSVLIGASSVAQLEANVATVSNLTFTRDELASIENILV